MFVNYGFVGVFGEWLGVFVMLLIMCWVFVFLFIVMGLWIFVLDKFDEDEVNVICLWFGVFGVMFVVFFFVEMGDKMQIVIVVLVVCFQDYIGVVVGMMFGMMFVNVLVILFGDCFVYCLLMKFVYGIVVVLFVVFGVLVLLGIGV